MQVDGTCFHVVGGRVVFGKVVGKIQFAFGPHNDKVALVDTIMYPVEAHVHGFGPFEFGTLSGKAVGSGIVGDYLCGLQLLISKFFEHLSEEYGLLSIVE